MRRYVLLPKHVGKLRLGHWHRACVLQWLSDVRQFLSISFTLQWQIHGRYPGSGGDYLEHGTPLIVLFPHVIKTFLAIHLSVSAELGQEQDDKKGSDAIPTEIALVGSEKRVRAMCF